MSSMTTSHSFLEIRRFSRRCFLQAIKSSSCYLSSVILVSMSTLNAFYSNRKDRNMSKLTSPTVGPRFVFS